MIMQMTNIDQVSSFVISYNFLDDLHETEIEMLVNGSNILSFKRDGQVLTTRWNLDELAFWFRDFLDNMTEDPYPVSIEGEYATIKDVNAREFDSDNDEEFDAYYDKLDEWDLRHRWHPASSGAILADLYFQLVGDNVEVSWNNLDPEDGVCFEYKLGGMQIPREQFVSEVDSFLKAYAEHWFQ